MHQAFFERDNWLELLLSTDRSELAGKLAKDLSQVGELALDAMQSGDIRAAINWISLGLYCDQSVTRASLGEVGTFRASKYRYLTKYLLETLSGICQTADRLSLGPEMLAYFESVKALVKLAPAVGEIDRSARAFLRRNAQVCLKSILVRIDSLFMIGHQGDHIGSTEAISTYPVEELAEGASYLIHCIDEEIGIEGTHFRHIPEDKIAKGVFDKLIIKACKIRRYAEAEILIDAFDYRCARRGRETIIRAPFPDFEKSIRLGYIQNQQAHDQSRVMRDLAIEKGAVSVYAVADEFFDRLHGTVVKRVEHPVDRYTFQLPNVPTIRKIFSTDEITVEEDIYLREVGTFELVSLEELKNFEFPNGLTLLDISKVHRLFMFLARLAMRQLAPMLKDEPELAFRSLLPIFKEDVLKGLLEWCVKPEQVGPVLEFLSHRQGMGGVYDMQYRPLVYADKYHMVPLHIAGMTNWYRNVARDERHRLIDDLETDAAERALAVSLRTANCDHVEAGYETVLGKQLFEIDVVCRFGDYLFLFECKHPMLPCNAYELRTSYKHMRTGARQLETIKNILSNPELEKELYRRLGWRCGPAKEIATCIVSGNGMFSGLRVNGHPVRRLAELVNMISTGILRTMQASADVKDGRPVVRTDDLVERRLWTEGVLTPEFLSDYLQRDLLANMLFESMIEYEETFSLGEGRMTLVSYALDAEAVATAISALPSSPPAEEDCK